MSATRGPDSSAMRDLTKWTVSGLTAAALCYRRDSATALFVFGAVLNALLSKVLKRLINNARPSGSALSDPGMPSSHAQSLFFFAAYLCIVTHRSTTVPEFFEHTPRLAMKLLRETLAYCFPAVALGLALVRVRDGLHTHAQVFVGAVIGGAMGCAWLEWAQVPLQRRMHAGEVSSGWVAGLFAVGLLVVGSAERVLAAKLKRG